MLSSCLVLAQHRNASHMVLYIHPARSSPTTSCVQLAELIVMAVDLRYAPPSSLHEGQTQRSQHAKPNDSPARNNNLLVRERRTGIPRQVAQSVQAVVHKGKAETHLQHDLCEDRQGSERRGDGRGFEVPAEHGGGEIADAEEIHGSRQRDARDAVEARAVPCYLSLVDRDVWGDGAVSALRGKDRCAGLWGHGFCRGGSVGSLPVSFLSGFLVVGRRCGDGTGRAGVGSVCCGRSLPSLNMLASCDRKGRGGSGEGRGRSDCNTEDGR